MSQSTLCVDPVVLSYLPRLVQVVEQLDREAISEYIAVLDGARRRRASIWFCGNGGSASTASHVIADLNKGATGPRAPRFKALSLNDSVSTMLAWANDVAYEEIFVQQLRNFLEAGDVVVALSGSGNSANVLKAVEYAKTVGAFTVGFTGFAGGRLRPLVDLSVHAAVDDMQIAEDVHMMIHHVALQALAQRAS
jgi:D-sedoheptulose 7-phosphate isomerase